MAVPPLLVLSPDDQAVIEARALLVLLGGKSGKSLYVSKATAAAANVWLAKYVVP